MKGEWNASLGLTSEQVLLLQAATLRGPRAVAAFERWILEVDVASLDRGSNRLLPLLWHNLVAHGVDHAVMPLLKGVYRHTWFGNQVLLTKLRGIDAALSGAGVPVLALKGLALAYGTYPSPGLRPMDDLDILVRPADLSRAIEVLRSRGWVTPVARPEALLEVVNGTELHDEAWDRLDLHGHVYPGGLRADFDAARWERAVRIDTGETSFLALDHTDQLLHAVVHGGLAEQPAIRWVGDVLAILARPGVEVDWERLLGDAEREGYGRLVAHRLPPLIELFEAPIPEQPLARMTARRSTVSDRVRGRIETGPPIFFAGRLLRRWLDYRRWRQGGGPERRAVGFPGYLQRIWSVDDARNMPGQVARHVAERLRLDLGRRRSAAHAPRDG